MSEPIRDEAVEQREATLSGLLRLGCCHCDRVDFDGVNEFPTDWRNIQEVKIQGHGLWESHLGVCPECETTKLDESAYSQDGLPPWEEEESEPAEADSIHPIVKQIIDRDCHVGESNKEVVRHVISKLRDGYATLRKMPVADRRLLVEQCVARHRSNFQEYVEVMSGFTRTVDDQSTGRGLPNMLTGKEVVALMRKHRMTINA
jgi:hypothetical protein